MCMYIVFNAFNKNGIITPILQMRKLEWVVILTSVL